MLMALRAIKHPSKMHVLRFPLKALKIVAKDASLSAPSLLPVREGSIFFKAFESLANESMMKKYGLQLRVNQSQQKKQPQRPPVSTSNIFGNNEDDDIVERHKKAMEEDPSVFDYGVYDQIQEAKVKPLIQDRKERKSKYIETLMEKAKQRDMEHKIIYERKLVRDRSKEDHLFAGKDKFVTGAYKWKLVEQAKSMEEERLRELQEEKDDVCIALLLKSDLSEFYFNLSKNVAYVGKATESHKPNEQDDSVVDTFERRILKAEAPPSSFRTKESDEAEVSADPENNAKLFSEEIKPPALPLTRVKLQQKNRSLSRQKLIIIKEAKTQWLQPRSYIWRGKKQNNSSYRLLSTASIRNQIIRD
ncbi:hypothetical protein Syun_009204 [Stephania yunnanensis]|uniref:Nuclear speckle splicing regulatory protein 1 N-terminal domain-containing protein n=1 Tax=Stephania yunnanensis TaxID=152371 RepID=A0AAP0PQN5_9MAGN